MILPVNAEHGQVARNDDVDIRDYFSIIADSVPLSRDRESELARRIKEGDREARNELICANLRFVVDVARRYCNRGVAFSDLICAGNMGLITAAERFDGERGFKFISYAVWWVRQAIQQSLAEQSRTVRLPLTKIHRLQEIARTAQQLTKDNEKEPEPEEIAAELEAPTAEIMDVVLSARAVCSLDEAVTADDDSSLLDILADEKQEAPDASVCKASRRDQIHKILGRLSKREEFILKLCFGLDGQGQRTLEDIGAQLNLTRERVRQIREQALDRLRGKQYGTMLKALQEESALY